VFCFLFVNPNSNVWKVTLTTVDPRTWYTENPTSINQLIGIPTNIPTGQFELLLNLPDEYPALAPRPEYSIQLANLNLWEPLTGFNKLNFVVTVSATLGTTPYTGTQVFQPVGATQTQVTQTQVTQTQPTQTQVTQTQATQTQVTQTQVTQTQVTQTQVTQTQPTQTQVTQTQATQTQVTQTQATQQFTQSQTNLNIATGTQSAFLLNPSIPFQFRRRI